MFDEPTRISFIKVWNYSKTPSRGVKEIEVSPSLPSRHMMVDWQIFLDDVLVYKGNLRPSPSKDVSLATERDCDETDVWWWRIQDSTGLAPQGKGELELDLSQSILFTNEPSIIASEVTLFRSSLALIVS